MIITTMVKVCNMSWVFVGLENVSKGFKGDIFGYKKKKIYFSTAGYETLL